MSEEDFDFDSVNDEDYRDYVDPHLIKDLIFLEKMLLDNQTGRAAESCVWSEWKSLNQKQDPSYLVSFMSEEDKKAFSKVELDRWKINAAIQGAANLSLKAYNSKRELSWQAAVEWGRLCTEAHKSNHLEPGRLDEIRQSSKPSYLRDLADDIVRFCAAEKGILKAVLGKKPTLNSVLGVFH